jgi:phospho-N-acetylmuramoyl-pentapeptide-transferase
MRRLKAHAAISQYTPEHAGKVGTPSMGGIAPVLAILSVAVWLDAGSPKWSNYDPIIIGLVGFGILGFFDDFLIPRLYPKKRGFGWTPKLIAQIAIVIIMILATGDTDPFDGLVKAVCILFFANAVNFSDGLDGLCAGLLIVSLIAFSSGISLAIIGALIPFLFLNAPPAKIFMGDVGALPIGAAFGWLVCERYIPSISGIDVLTMVLVSMVFILELVLVPMQLFWVKVFGRRLIPASPLHHSFEKLGWPETRITAIFILTQLVLTILAMTLVGS